MVANGPIWSDRVGLMSFVDIVTKFGCRECLSLSPNGWVINEPHPVLCNNVTIATQRSPTGNDALCITHWCLTIDPFWWQLTHTDHVLESEKYRPRHIKKIKYHKTTNSVDECLDSMINEPFPSVTKQSYDSAQSVEMKYYISHIAWVGSEMISILLQITQRFIHIFLHSVTHNLMDFLSIVWYKNQKAKRIVNC